MTLCARVVSLEPLVIRGYPEKRTRVTYPNWNLESYETFSKARITKWRRKSPCVTGEASISKDERVEGVNSGRWAKVNCSLKTKHSPTIYLLSALFLNPLESFVPMSYWMTSLYTNLAIATRWLRILLCGMVYIVHSRTGGQENKMNNSDRT